MTPQFHLRPISGFGAVSCRRPTSNIRSNKHAHQMLGFVYNVSATFSSSIEVDTSLRYLSLEQLTIRSDGFSPKTSVRYWKGIVMEYARRIFLCF